MRVNAPDMPAKLAASAFNLFATAGIHKINMDAIAANADVTKGSLYWHYKSKKEVIEAAASHYYQNYYRQVNKEIAPIRDPYKRLKRVVEFSVRSCLLDEKNRVFTMEILTLSLYDKDIRKSWAQFYAGVREFYIGLVEAARAAGQIKTSDSRLAVDFMLEAMEGIKQRALFEPQICSKTEEKVINEGLMEIIGRF
jgi:AcrR family transcriptional regulator